MKYPLLKPNAPPAITEKMELGNAGIIILIPLAKKSIPGPQIPADCTNDCIDSLLVFRKLV